MAAKSGVPGTVRRACAALLAVLLVFTGCRKNGGLTVEQLVTYKPKNPVAAALGMLGLFALKSVDFIMHSGVLYAASGVMFPLPVALALNIVGAAIMVTPCYFIGRALGT
ncbi:MAG: hypothetical protein II557_07930, partial [Clostridia bacterium]|nr:hypothetical protein [Clostridia bacterium]